MELSKNEVTQNLLHFTTLYFVKNDDQDKDKLYSETEKQKKIIIII